MLIPSPNVTDDHQYKNAKVLEDADAAIIIRETEFDGKIVSDTVNSLVKNEARRREMSENIGKFYDIETGKKIYSEIESLVAKYKKEEK